MIEFDCIPVEAKLSPSLFSFHGSIPLTFKLKLFPAKQQIYPLQAPRLWVRCSKFFCQKEYQYIRNFRIDWKEWASAELNFRQRKIGDELVHLKYNFNAALTLRGQTDRKGVHFLVHVIAEAHFPRNILDHLDINMFTRSKREASKETLNERREMWENNLSSKQAKKQNLHCITRHSHLNRQRW